MLKPLPKQTLLRQRPKASQLDTTRRKSDGAGKQVEEKRADSTPHCSSGGGFAMPMWR